MWSAWTIWFVYWSLFCSGVSRHAKKLINLFLVLYLNTYYPKLPFYTEYSVDKQGEDGLVVIRENFNTINCYSTKNALWLLHYFSRGQRWKVKLQPLLETSSVLSHLCNSILFSQVQQNTPTNTYRIVPV